MKWFNLSVIVYLSLITIIAAASGNREITVRNLVAFAAYTLGYMCAKEE